MSNFKDLEKAQKNQIEVQAELLKQKEILKKELELDSKKHMDAILSNMSKSQMYDLNDSISKLTDMSKSQMYYLSDNASKQTDVSNQNEIKDALVKGKERMMMLLIIVVIVLLALGLTPSGAWYETLQTSYVETLVDIFKVCMIVFGSWLAYKLFKK